MKLHSDSVLDKLEDKEKEYDKLREVTDNKQKRINDLGLEFQVKEQESAALKWALEKKIDKVLTLEREVRELKSKVVKYQRESVSRPAKGKSHILDKEYQ